VNDVRSDPRFYDGVDAVTGFETRSLLCAPLRHLGEITGAIAIVNKHEGEFTDDDLGLLEAVSSIAAVALENARLYTATRARADELARLNEIGIALTSTLNYSLVVHAALNQARRLFGADRVSLLQLDPQTDELCFVQTLVEGEPVSIPLRLAAGEGIARWALEQRQPVLIEDAQENPHFSDRTDRHLGTRTRTVMAVPLLTREHATGVLEIISYQADAYTLDSLHTLQAVASMLTAALENAGLYSELKALLREREETQTQLIHSEKMAALGRLVASIAHEINNPLQAVQGCLTLAQEKLGLNSHQDKLERYLDVAGNEIERIAAIVRRMRDFYRPAREGMSFTDLHAVLESVLELTNKQLQHSDVVVERTWAEELPKVWGNSDHLKQVFLNLVLNAIDAMPTGGTLRVSTAQAQMQSNDSQPPQPAVHVKFSDTGEGMPPETQSRVFEPFFTTKEGGTGLGLSISYGIIQAHNGEITVTSQVGEGTTFTILLPMERPDM
jgi:two-component system NtrC family sensor kinase